MLPMVLLSLSFVCSLFVFFFQAEDGIRDLIVTGVQRVLFRSLLASDGSNPRRPNRDVALASHHRLARKRGEGLRVHPRLFFAKHPAMDAVVFRTDHDAADLLLRDRQLAGSLHDLAIGQDYIGSRWARELHRSVYRQFRARKHRKGAGLAAGNYLRFERREDRLQIDVPKTGWSFSGAPSPRARQGVRFHLYRWRP